MVTLPHDPFALELVALKTPCVGGGGLAPAAWTYIFLTLGVPSTYIVVVILEFSFI
jgi:hypothetical protein